MKKIQVGSVKKADRQFLIHLCYIFGLEFLYTLDDLTDNELKEIIKKRLEILNII